MRFAQILWDKAHWVFEADTKPDFPPGPDGEPIVIVDITAKPEVQEGWDYNADTGEFTPPPKPELEPLPPVPLTEEEQYRYQNIINQEYLIVLAELNSL